MNDNFNTALKNSGMSMYALSKRSGVPYTTINELHSCKNDINQCAASTLWRLAAALDVPAEDLLNVISYLDGVRGKYRGISYVWISDKTSRISFEYNGKTVTLDTGKYLNMPSRIEYYGIIAGWMIRDYINKAEFDRQAEAAFERIAHK